MVEFVGTNIKFGMIQAATWRTAVAMAAGKQIRYISADPALDAQLLRSEGLSGTPFRSPGLKGNELHTGPFKFPLDFETVHTLLAYAFGSNSAASSVGTDPAWLHELIVANSDKGIFATMVIGEETVFIREYPTVKVGDVAISIQQGAEPTIEVQCTPDTVVTDESGANGLSELLTLDERTTPALVEFNHLSMLINARTGTALTDSDDRIEISGIELNLTKALRTDSVTTRNAPYVDEPIRNGYFDVKGTITLAEMEDHVRFNEALTKVENKAQILLDGGLIGTETNYQLRLEIASLQFDNVTGANPTGPGIITPSFPFTAAFAATNPSGFTHGDAIRAFVTNSDPNAPLT